MKPADEELELTRLLAAETDGTDRGVELLRQRGPDATELASLASRLALRGVEVTPSSRPPLETPWKKWAFAAVGGASALLLWLVLRAPQPSFVQPKAPPPEPITSAEHGSAEVSKPSSLRSPPRALAPGATAAPSETAPSVQALAPSAAPEPMPPSAELGSQPEGTSLATPPALAGASRRPSPSAASTARPSTGDELAPDQAGAPSEIELLREARFALKQSPERALELTDRHARLYPGGKLAQERELIAITALVSLGRRTAALSRGASFERAFPRSAYREQLNELLR